MSPLRMRTEVTTFRRDFPLILLMIKSKFLVDQCDTQPSLLLHITLHNSSLCLLLKTVRLFLLLVSSTACCYHYGDYGSAVWLGYTLR